MALEGPNEMRQPSRAMIEFMAKTAASYQATDPTLPQALYLVAYHWDSFVAIQYQEVSCTGDQCSFPLPPMIHSRAGQYRQ